MTYPPGFFAFAMLASMKPSERQRATAPLALTMFPGPLAQVSAVSAMAITTQVRDGLRRERRVTEDVSAAVVEAVRLAKKDPTGFTTEMLRSMPALSSIATDLLRDEILSLADPKVVEQAVYLAVHIANHGGGKPTAAEAEKWYPELVAALTPAQRGEIVT